MGPVKKWLHRSSNLVRIVSGVFWIIVGANQYIGLAGMPGDLETLWGLLDHMGDYGGWILILVGVTSLTYPQWWPLAINLARREVREDATERPRRYADQDRGVLCARDKEIHELIKRIGNLQKLMMEFDQGDYTLEAVDVSERLRRLGIPCHEPYDITEYHGRKLWDLFLATVLPSLEAGDIEDAKGALQRSIPF